jgi:hypothetical protein
MHDAMEAARPDDQCYAGSMHARAGSERGLTWPGIQHTYVYEGQAGTRLMSRVMSVVQYGEQMTPYTCSNAHLLHLCIKWTNKDASNMGYNRRLQDARNHYFTRFMLIRSDGGYFCPQRRSTGY